MLGRCLVTSCNRGNLDIITVVLGSDTKGIRTRDSIKLIEYVYSNYEKVNIKKIAEEKFEDWRKTSEGNIYINKGIDDNVILTLGEQKYTEYPINKNDIKDINVEINSVNYFEAPIEENKVIR